MRARLIVVLSLGLLTAGAAPPVTAIIGTNSTTTRTATTSTSTSGASTSSQGTTSANTPGFGIGVAVLGILGALAAIAIRKDA